MVGHLRNLLVNEGIQCDVKTPFLAVAKGDLPVTDCWSQLWIMNDEDLEKALGVIDAALAQGVQPGGTWKCSKCGEEVERQFEVCWQCGSVRPDGDA
jgi:hypothetical protein